MSNGTKTYVITGATGAVGKALAGALTARGHDVRPITRAGGVALDDREALTEAFAGADGAFLMVPFDRQAEDLHAWEARICGNLAAAVVAAHVPRVVCLSGTSAHRGETAGSARGAAIMEEGLNALDLPELVHLRGCFFMENHLQAVGAILASGVYPGAFAPDIATPMVAARDIGEEAAQILGEQSFDQPRVREVLGARDYTMAEATKILGAAIGDPSLRYEQVPYEEAEQAMVSAGVSRSFASAIMETARSFNEGVQWAKEPRTARNTTETTLESFAAEEFAPAYAQARGQRQTERSL